MSEATYYKPGDVIESTAAAAVTAGEVQLIGGKCAVAQADTAIGKTVKWQIKGICKITLDGTGHAAPAGSPVWFDASANAFSVVPKDRTTTILDFFAGCLSASVAASATVGYAFLNDENPDFPAFANNIHEVVSANKTLDAEDVGKVLNVDTDAKVITLPATVIGYRYIIRNLAANGAVLVKISPNASDKIAGPDMAGTDNKAHQNTKATAICGDYVELVADGAVGWYIASQRGIWVEEA